MINHTWPVVRDASMGAGVKDLGFDLVTCLAQHFNQCIKHRAVLLVDQPLLHSRMLLRVASG